MQQDLCSDFDRSSTRLFPQCRTYSGALHGYKLVPTITQSHGVIVTNDLPYQYYLNFRENGGGGGGGWRGGWRGGAAGFQLVKGDSIWSICQLFLKSPHEIWTRRGLEQTPWTPSRSATEFIRTKTLVINNSKDLHYFSKSAMSQPQEPKFWVIACTLS